MVIPELAYNQKPCGGFKPQENEKMKYKKVDIPRQHRGYGSIYMKFVVLYPEEGPKFRAGFANHHIDIVDRVREKEGLAGEMIGYGELFIDDGGFFVEKDNEPFMDEAGRRLKLMLVCNGQMSAFGEYPIISNLDKYPEFSDAPRRMLEELLRDYCRENCYKLKNNLAYVYCEGNRRNIFWPALFEARAIDGNRQKN